VPPLDRAQLHEVLTAPARALGSYSGCLVESAYALWGFNPLIASSANEAAGRNETGTQSLLPNWLLNV
jgi:hypothetical protein